MDNKIKALAEFLGINESEIKVSEYNNNFFETSESEYLVLTEEEANESVKDEVLQTVWTFNTDFILDHSTIKEWTDRTERAFAKMQEELCEDANEIVLAVIEDFDEFVEDAIDAEGRGYFLSLYDGEENESGEYYIYRTN